MTDICFDIGDRRKIASLSIGLCPTLIAKMGTGGNNVPIVVEENLEMKCFNITACDANGKRKDRPNGGLYVTEADSCSSLTHGNPGDRTVIVRGVTSYGIKGDPGRDFTCYHESSQVITTKGEKQAVIMIKTYDARGNGNGDVANAIVGDHCDRVTDYTPIVCENGDGDSGGLKQVSAFVDTGHGDYWSESGASGTIRAEGENRPSRPSNVIVGQNVCFQQNQRNEVRLIGGDGSIAGSVVAEAGMKNQNYVVNDMICVNGSQDPISNSGKYSYAVGRNCGLDNVIADCKVVNCLAFEPGIARREGDGGRFVSELSPTLRAQMGDNLPAVAMNVVSIDGDKVGKKERKGGSGLGVSTENVSYTLTAKDVHGVSYSVDSCFQKGCGSDTVHVGPRVMVEDDGMVSELCVRRLLPVETERLMGFPDGYTIPCFKEITDDLVLEFQMIDSNWSRICKAEPSDDSDDSDSDDDEQNIDARVKSPRQIRSWLEKISNPETCPDSSRYKCCGNSMCVNCMAWIGERINKYSKEETCRP